MGTNAIFMAISGFLQGSVVFCDHLTRRKSVDISPMSSRICMWACLDFSLSLSGLPNANAKSQRFSYAISQLATLPPVAGLNRSSK